MRSPATEQEWASFHRIRRSVLFEKRGLIGVYDPNHPDDRKPTNHPMLLLFDSRHAESFAIQHGARRMESSVASDAVGFYDRCGYRILPDGSSGASVHMYKDLC